MCYFRPDQIFGAIAGDRNGFDFTFLLTFSSLFWCARQSLQELNVAEQTLDLHLPALKNRDPAFKEKLRLLPRKRGVFLIIVYLVVLGCVHCNS